MQHLSKCRKGLKTSHFAFDPDMLHVPQSIGFLYWRSDWWYGTLCCPDISLIQVYVPCHYWYKCIPNYRLWLYYEGLSLYSGHCPSVLYTVSNDWLYKGNQWFTSILLQWNTPRLDWLSSLTIQGRLTKHCSMELVFNVAWCIMFNREQIFIFKKSNICCAIFAPWRACFRYPNVDYMWYCILFNCL